MKRLIGLAVAVALGWGGHLFRSQQYFLGAEVGGSSLRSESSGLFSLRWGYYYYLPNPAQISGKFYLNLTNLTKIEGSLQSVEIWNQFLWNRWGALKPYLGVGVGYVDKYSDSDGAPSGFGEVGVEAGVLFQLSRRVDLFGGVKITNGEDSFNFSHPLYRYSIGI
ncbi:MAG: hypothetical protein ABGW77_05995, partial [Campylobacterales bacterium]